MAPIASAVLSSTSRSPTCLSCLRRLARPGPGITSGITSGAVSSGPYTQTRGKRLKAQGVVVRLLEDVPKFGRRNAIFRVQAGRMRNLWYPTKKAEYMTAERFAALGLTREAIGERDPTFDVSGAEEVAAEEAGATAAAAWAARVELEHVPPARAQTILTTRVPQTLSFARKPIANPATTPGPALPGQPIFGSVSTMDVAHAIRRALDESGDAEAARVVVEPAHVRFVGLEHGSGGGRGGDGDGSVLSSGASSRTAGVLDRVKALGRYEVEISLLASSSGVGATAAAAAATLGGVVEEILPVRKVVEVLPASDAAAAAAAADDERA